VDYDEAHVAVGRWTPPSRAFFCFLRHPAVVGPSPPQEFSTRARHRFQFKVLSGGGPAFVGRRPLRPSSRKSDADSGSGPAVDRAWIDQSSMGPAASGPPSSSRLLKGKKTGNRARGISFPSFITKGSKAVSRGGAGSAVSG